MAKRPSLAPPSDDFTSQKAWNAARAKELYGGSPDPEAREKLLTNARRILQQVQESIEKHVSIPGILEYITKRSKLLSDQEVYHLRRSDFSPRQKSLLLVNYIADRKKTPVERFYLCLLDSYNQPGMEGHYTVAQQLRSYALREITQKAAVKDIEEIALGMENVSLRPAVARTLLELLEVSHAKDDHLPDDLHSVCQQWISSCHDCSLERLVQALLCTPGLGYLVTGIRSMCESNPPEVWRFIEAIAEKWFSLAVFMGYKNETLSEIKSCPNVSDQICLFMRVWRVPNCGSQMGKILEGLRKAFEEPVQAPQDSIIEGNQQEDLGTKQLHQKADADRGLLEACLDKNWELAELLMHPGALECKDTNGCTPLLVCCKERQIELVMNLTCLGASVTTADGKGNICLHFSEVLNHNVILTTLLDAFKSREINVDQRNRTGMTPLLIACLMGDCCVDGVKALLEAGADPDGNDQAYFRPLTAACSGGHERIMNLLLDKGAKIDIQDKEGRTPLLCACLGFHFDIAKILIQNKADIAKADVTRRTPLYVCADSNACEMAEVLLTNGANPNTIRFLDSDVGVGGNGQVEETPLARACAKGYLDMVKLLCDKGANINEMCSGAVPPMGFSIIHRQHHVVDYLAKHPKFDRTLRGLGPVVIIATNCGDWQCVLYLLESCLQCKPAEALYRAAQENQHHLHECIQLYVDRANAQNDEENLRIVMQNEINDNLGKRSISSSELQPETYLNRLCQIVVNILRSKVDINMEALIENAKAAGLQNVANVLLQCFNFTMDPLALKNDFLLGKFSALRFVTQNRLINMDDFFVCVRNFYPDSAQEFCNNLVLAFHAVSGGDELPLSTDACLKKLLMGGFVPAVSKSTPMGGIDTDNSGIFTEPAILRNLESDGLHSDGLVGTSEAALGSLLTKQETDEGKKVEQPTLRLLLTELDPVTDWFELGVFLDVDPGQLKQIQSNYPNNGGRCRIEMLNLWLKTSLHPTWDKVAQAASDAKESKVAQAIREKHCSIVHSSSVVQDESASSLQQGGGTPPRGRSGATLNKLHSSLSQGSVDYEADPSQANDTATMERTEYIPPLTQSYMSTAQLKEVSAGATSSAHVSRLPSHQEDVACLTQPVKKLHDSVRHTIDDKKDLETIIDTLRRNCENAMRKGKCEVEVNIYIELSPKP